MVTRFFILPFLLSKTFSQTHYFESILHSSYSHLACRIQHLMTIMQIYNKHR